MEKDAQFAFRVEAALREEFVRTCKSIDRPAGQVLREFMREFVSEQVQAPLFQEPIARYKVNSNRKSQGNS
ncbi:MAG: antitoxin of toxin-antitoxin stability system [Burkholderiales bacterium]